MARILPLWRNRRANDRTLEPTPVAQDTGLRLLAGHRNLARACRRAMKNWLSGEPVQDAMSGHRPRPRGLDVASPQGSSGAAVV